jgi:broad specificity phosphatase PhoE
MAIFTLMRHGEADFDAMRDRRLVGGCRDWIPLSDMGVRQVESSLGRLREGRFDLILTSPMSRALHTAAIVSRALNLPLHVEFDLHEWLPDLTFCFESFDPVQRAINDRKAHGNEWPKGETRTWEPFSQVRARVLPILQRYVAAGRSLVVCHHTVIEALTGVSLAWTESAPYELATVSSAGSEAPDGPF